MRTPFLPTRRLFLALLVPAAFLMLGTVSSLFLLLFGGGLLVIAVFVIHDARHTPGPDSFVVERTHAPRLSLGEANSVVVTVHRSPEAESESNHALPIQIRDETPVGLSTDHQIVHTSIAIGESVESCYHLYPRRRGDYRFGDVVVRLGSPRGLLLRQLTFPAPEPARVYPNLRAIERYDLLSARQRLHEAGLRRTRLIGSGNEFERLRDYLPDDDYRRIDWKATARRHRPITVDYETERSQNLIVMLDTGRLMGATTGDLDKLDHAVNAALLLAYVAMEMGDKVGLLAFSDHVRRYVPLRRGQQGFGTILDQLYRLNAEPVESDPVRAITELARRQMKRSYVVLFTDVAEGTDEDELVGSLGMLARRHLPICVMIANPELARLADTPPSDSRAAYERVVARSVLDERRAIVQRIERRGAIVLDAPPNQLSAGIINRYLELKATMRL